MYKYSKWAEYYDVFHDACCSGLLNQGLRIEQRGSVSLEVLLWILGRDAEPLKLSDDAHLRRFVLNDDVAWLRIGLERFSALNNGFSFAHLTVRDPSFDDDVT